MLARIHVHADWAAALVRALAAADCVSVLRGEGMLDGLVRFSNGVPELGEGHMVWPAK